MRIESPGRHFRSPKFRVSVQNVEMEVSSFVTFCQYDFPVARMRRALSVEHTVSVVSVSVAQVVMIACPFGLPRARAYTVYEVAAAIFVSHGTKSILSF